MSLAVYSHTNDRPRRTSNPSSGSPLEIHGQSSQRRYGMQDCRVQISHAVAVPASNWSSKHTALVSAPTTARKKMCILLSAHMERILKKVTIVIVCGV